jgi:hypothetical protein
VTSPHHKPEPRDPRPAEPWIPSPPSEEDLRELRDPAYDFGPEYHELPWPRPEFFVVISQLPGLQPDQPRSLNEILNSVASRILDSEPDREAEP